VPAEIWPGLYTSLSALRLSNNSLTGSVPADLCCRHHNSGQYV
jgi:hypothetical protein